MASDRGPYLAVLWALLFGSTLAGLLGLSWLNHHRWAVPLAAVVATAGVVVDLATDRGDIPSLGEGL